MKIVGRAMRVGLWGWLFVAFPLFAATPAPLAAVDNQFVVRTSGERTTLDRTTGKLVSTVNVSCFNLGGRSLVTPLHAVVQLSMVSGTVSQVQMPGAMGGVTQPPYNAFYVDLSAQFPQGAIAPNAAAQTTLTFVRDRDVRFSYEIIPYAALVEVHPPTILVQNQRRAVVAFTVDEGQILQFPVFGDDPDGEFVTLSAAPAISNATFVASNGVNAVGEFVFSPDFDQAGTYAVRFSAFDPLGLSTSDTAQITVQNVNRPPTLSGPTNATVDEGGVLSVVLTATDPDGDPVTTIATPLPTNAVFVPETATLFFAPDFTQGGVYDLTLYASDGSASSATQVLHVAVIDVPQGTPGDTNGLKLVVDEVPPLSLLTAQRITGAVNNSGGVGRTAATMALITGLNPATGTRGQTLPVTLTGQAAGIFATHFGSSSAASFGNLTVESLAVSNANLAVATLRIAADAALGPRNVTVATSNELAVSIVAFNVMPGTIDIAGTLVDQDTTNAIGGAIITVQGTGFTTTSAPDGTFSLNGLPPGDYTLIINPPDHALITLPVTAVAGQHLLLGNIGTPATVFDPAAPASVSLLSVLGRGMGTYGGIADMTRAKQTITDALLLTGGTEAGVLDEFGNQLNPQLTGAGISSILPDGVRRLAERLDRGESIGLADTLYPFTYTFTWTNGPPPTLAEWLETLQGQINSAWAAPNQPENYLPIVIFNAGRNFSPEPPVLTPMTRLSPAQNYMFVISMLSLASLGTNSDLTVSSIPAVQGLRRVGPLDANTNAAPARLWTSYWRGFGVAKNNFFNMAMGDATASLAKLAGVMCGVAASADLRVGLVAFPMVGYLATEITTALGVIGISARVPEPPKIIRGEILPGPQHSTNAPGAPRVFVHFRRSASDRRDGRYLYSLYRFRSSEEGRQLVAFDSFHQPTQSNKTELVLRDLAPFYGSTFYALTLTRLYTVGDEVSDNELNNTAPFWNATVNGLNPYGAFLAARKMIVSDYSDPLIMYVGSAASSIPISDIELDPDTAAAFYSDTSGAAEERKIFKIDLFGSGEHETFAFTQFSDPGQGGLAMDRNGALFTLNKGSQSLFGGRLFEFDGATGARTHAGQVNYYSRMLYFAHPTDAYALDMGPAASGVATEQDLYLVDMLAGQVKRAPVQAPYDPFRRVAQPYADYPYAARPSDMEHDTSGNTFVLVPEAFPRRAFNDREKGSMHRPPGAPIKIDCPPSESNPYVDPVYLHSGEYYEDNTDITIRGVGLDFTWVRKYRSKIGTNTVQGNNWDFSYNIFVTHNHNTGGVVVHDGNTRADEYQRSGTTNLWTLREFFRELVKNPDDTYTLEFEDKGVWKFHGFTGSLADGRIKESVDRHGNKLQFFYDGFGRLDKVVDTLGRDIFITYNSEGFISDIIDFAGRTWHYAYYGAAEAGGNSGDLKSCRTPIVTGTPNGNDFPLGKTTTYTYSKGFTDARLNGNLLTVTDPKGQTYLVNTYATTTDPDDLDFDRVLKQRWGDPTDTIELSYVEVNPTPANGNSIIRVILNDRVGHVKEYFYNAFNQCTIEREYTGAALNHQFTTDSQNRPINKLRPTDPAYFENRYEWNADSLKRRQIHPNGNITEWVYEGDLSPNAPARTRGNVRIIRHLPGTHRLAGDQQVITEQYEYDTSFGRGCCGFNSVTRHTDGRGNVTLKSYNSFGDLTQAVQRVSSIVETYEYDARGRTVKIIAPDNGSGHRRVDRFVYYGPGDGVQNGYLKQSIQDDGGFNITTLYEYDSRGNAVRLVDPRGSDTLNVYNQLDQVVRAYSAEAAPGVRYYTDSFYDANGNVIRSERLNMDEFGTVVAANPWITSTTQFDILNTTIRRVEEVDTNRTVTVEYQLDGNRNVLLTRNGEAVNGNQPHNVARTVFDERDKPFQMIDAPGAPEQSTTQLDYDPNGNVVRTTVGLEHPAPRVATRAFDPFDRKVTDTDAMGNVDIYRYDANHNCTQMVRYAEMHDVLGSTNNVRQRDVIYEYDDMNRQVAMRTRLFDPATQAPVGDGESVSRTTYNDIGLVTRVVDDLGSEARSVYDRLGRLSVSIDQLTNTLTRVYDAGGNQVAAVASERASTGGVATVYATTNVYDKLNRLVRTVDSGGHTNQLFYDSRHNLVRTVDGRGNVMRSVYDGLSRRLQTIYELTSDGTGAGSPAGLIVLARAYDDSSRLRSQTDGNGNTTTYDHDAQGRVHQVHLPDGRITRTYFDAQDNVVSNVDAVGTAEVIAYDLANRPIRRDVYPAAGVATDTTFEVFQYDGLNQLVRAENNQSVTTRRYDSASRLLDETQDGQTVRYRHDDVANVLGLEYPGGRVVSKAYDALHRRVTISDGSGPIAAYVYAGPNRVARMDYANNTRATLQYDGTKRITGITHVRDPGGANTVFDAWQFTWDGANNKTSRSDLPAVINHTYQYDSVNRMTRSSKTGPAIIDYALDPAGNRLTVTGGPSPGVYSRSGVGPEPRDAQVNQYTATPFDQRSYDANGNTTGINTGQPNARLLSYDYLNRLVRYENSAAGQVVVFRYDAAGRRIRKIVTGVSPSDTRYYYDGAQIIEEQDAGNATTATYVYGNDIDERITMRRGGQDYYYHGDDLLNVTKLTDASGTVVEQYAYGDYGQPAIKTGGGAPLARTAVGNPYLFTGREFDPETGLYFYRTRFLDPLAGRFISRDSIGAWGDPSSMGNGSTYAANNPWTLTDPGGTSVSEFEAGVIVGGAQGTATVAGGIIAAPVTLTMGALNVAMHPVNSWNGLCATMTKVASHPDGISAGWAHVLAPEFLRKGECWEYMSDYDRGKFYGQYGAETIGLVAGGGVGSAMNKASRMLKLRGLQWYRANRPFAKPGWIPPQAPKVTKAPTAPVPEAPAKLKFRQWDDPSINVGDDLARTLKSRTDASFVEIKGARLGVSRTPTKEYPGTRMIDVRNNPPAAAPGGRDIACPDKLARNGSFDWDRYEPIEVVDLGNGTYQWQNGMTRAAAAQKAGISWLPAKISNVR